MPSPRGDTARTVVRTLAGYLSRYRGRVAAALALLVLAKLATVSVPYSLKLIVDGLGRPETLQTLPLVLLLGYAALRFAGTLFGELRDVTFARVSHYVVADIHARTFAHLMSLSPRFHAQRNTGSLTREVERGIGGIAFLLGVGLFTLVPTVVEIVAVITVLLVSYGGWFAAVLAVTFVVYTGFTVIHTARREVFQRAMNSIDNRAGGRLVDSLLNYETVKTHGAEAAETERYRQLLRGWVDSAGRNQRELSRLHIGQSAIIACGVALVMVLAGMGVVHGGMTVGDLVLVNAYVIQVCLPLNALGFVFRQARDAMVDAEKLFRLLDQQPEIEDPPGRPALRTGAGEVVFDKVCFHYEPGRPVLHEVSFRIPPGRTVAVVGGSGSGKSTLARLLLRLYEPTAGRILVDGQDLCQVSLASLRAALGIVPQDTALFNESIAFNIAYGMSPHARAAMRLAARGAAQAAHLHEFIESLPEGYDTKVGERGMKLSGGERQRIAIARLIARNSRILIFDEATSALDPRAEQAIQAELDRLRERRSTLVIAHRMSTVERADEILVLEHGRIVERGDHRALLAQGGVYAQMCRVQLSEQRLHEAERRVAGQGV